ncbi:Pilin (type 1 fimbria component protein) [Izhakiella capsodis]|uniref:Pilin (Type 1 fimbria component protein) n=2 Tax=Izhakiella capsodis TaxID=1367852 RepID=A0A1I4W0T2_9GAMM|nr:Pilin (type 1 fimbria component protein) [Izhakiella capsodis]
MKRFIGNSVMPLAALSLLGLSVSAQAWGDTPAPSATDQTTVTITATVLDNTCEVQSSLAWDLGSVNGNDIIDKKPFSKQINLSNCGKAINSITVTQVGAAIDNTGHIVNTLKDATASGVVAEILTGDNAVNKGAILTGNNPQKFNVDAGKTTQTLKFTVELLQADGKKPTPGQFNAPVTLKLAYN